MSKRKQHSPESMAGSGRCWKALLAFLIAAARRSVRSTKNRSENCTPRSWGEPVNATGSRERANAVANDFLSRKLKPWGVK